VRRAVVDAGDAQVFLAGVRVAVDVRHRSTPAGEDGWDDVPASLGIVEEATARAAAGRFDGRLWTLVRGRASQASAAP
jgi:hypothetical protein